VAAKINSKGLSVVGRFQNLIGPPDDIAVPEGSPDGVALQLSGGQLVWAPVGGGVPTTRNIFTTAPLFGGGSLSADLTLGLNTDGTLQLDISNNLQLAPLSGDVITNAGSNVTSFRSFAGLSVLARAPSGAGIPTELTATANNQVLQELGGSLQFHTLDFSQLTGAVPITASPPIFSTGGATPNLTLSIDSTLRLNGSSLGLATLPGLSLLGVSASSTAAPAAITATTANTVPLYNGTSVAWSAVPAAATSGLVANWDPTVWAVYAIDYDNGSDANRGTATAASSSYADFQTAVIAAGAAPLKTMQGLGLVIPRSGAGRKLAVFIAARASGATYLKQDGVTTDSLDSFMSGLDGYSKIAIWGTGTNSTAGATKFTGTVADLTNAGAIVVPGTNASGYNPTAGATTTSVPSTKVGGGAPALANEPLPPLGYSTRYDFATATAALRNVARATAIVSTTSTTNDTVSPQAAWPATPSTSDIFYLEQPGVVCGGWGAAWDAAAAVTIAGVRSNGLINYAPGIVTTSLLKHMFTGAGAGVGNTALGTGGTGLFLIAATDPGFGSGTITRGSTMHAAGNILIQPGTFTQINGIVVEGTSLYEFLNGGVNANGSVYGGNLTVQGGSGSIYSGNPMFGNTIAGLIDRLIAGHLSIIGARVSIADIIITGAGASPAIVVSGMSGISLTNNTAGSTGNSDVGLDLTASFGSTITLSGTPTVTGTNGDVRLGGGTIITWAQAAAGIQDPHGNIIVSSSVAFPIQRLPTGTYLTDLVGPGFVKASGAGLLSVDATTYVSSVTATPPLFSSGGATPILTIQGAVTTGGTSTSATSLGALASGVLENVVSGGVSSPTVFVSTLARVPFGSGTNGGLTDSANLTFSGATLLVSTISGVITPTLSVTNSSGRTVGFTASPGTSGSVGTIGGNTGTVTFYSGGLNIPSFSLSNGVASFYSTPSITFASTTSSPLVPTSPTVVEWSIGATLSSVGASPGALHKWDPVTLNMSNSPTHITGTGLALASFDVLTITNGVAETVDVASTVTIIGPPVAAGSLTLTKPLALWVQAGNVEIDSLNAGGIVKASTAGILQIAVSGTDYAPAGNYITALTGDVTATGPGSVAATIGVNKVTYAKMQQASASTILGNPTGSLANVSEITLGSGLAFSGTTLIVTAGSFYQTIDNAGTAVTQRPTWNASTGLTAVDNGGATRTDVTVNLSTGVSGGQSAIGGTASGDNLILSSTSNATKGKTVFGSTSNAYYDEQNQQWVQGSSSPISGLAFQILKTQNSETDFYVANAGGSGAIVSLRAGLSLTNNTVAFVGMTMIGDSAGIGSGSVGNGAALFEGSPDNGALVTLSNRGTGDIVFATGTSRTERGRITNAGNFAWGTSALATSATNGFLYLSSMAGVPSGTPTSINSGASIPIVYDSTDKRLYIPSGASPLPLAQVTTGFATGLLKNTTTTGLWSIATAGTDYQAPMTAGPGINLTVSGTQINLGSIGSPATPTIAEFQGGPPTAATASSLQAVYLWDPVVITLTGTIPVTGSGLALMSLAGPTITDTSPVAVSSASTMAIVGPPVAGGSLTLTRPISLWVQSGLTQLDGAVGVNGATVPSNAAVVVGNTTSTNRDRVQLLVGGGTNNNDSPDNTYFLVSPSASSITNGQTLGVFATQRIGATTLTSTGLGAGTYTISASLYIDGALQMPPFGGGSGYTNGTPYALYIKQGGSFLGGGTISDTFFSAPILLSQVASVTAFEASVNAGTPAISFFSNTLVTQQTGGAATAGGTYTSTEQGMLNRIYSALRTYGLLT
jgi:hypothetical protein